MRAGHIQAVAWLTHAAKKCETTTDVITKSNKPVTIPWLSVNGPRPMFCPKVQEFARARKILESY
jgi:hypothetical protein